jgi:hypothetical protein
VSRSAVLALAAAGTLLLAGTGDLAPPTSLEGLAGWVDDRGAVTASMALVRLGALVVAAWLVVATLVVLLARVFGAVHVASAVARLLPFGLAVALASPVGAAPAQQDGTATMSVLPDDEAPPPAPTPAPLPTPAPEPQVADEWTVRPGDSFWSIAEEVLSEALEGPATEAQIATYWRTLIDANRDRLVSSSPDLIRPGQVFVLPPA